MKYRKAFNHITLISWTTFALTFVMCSITPNNTQANDLFKARMDYGAGFQPISVAIGDLNGDGEPDLAVANDYSNNVSLLLGNGDGTFQSAVNYPAGDGPYSVAIGDLNGDGHPDLAVANLRSNNVSILISNGGDQNQPAEPKDGGGSNAGCFISTAIYSFNLSKEGFVFIVICNFLLIHLCKTRKAPKK